jgi:predicted secreted protein
MMRRGIILLAAAALLSQSVAAGDEPRYNQIQLAAESSEQVGNDTLQVTLTTYGEHRELTELARQINADMEWALGKAREHQDIKAGTGSYQTYPLTTKDGRTTTGWRGQQTLLLESKAITELGELAGDLQEKLRITAMQFTVSTDKRTAVENRLIDTALNAFKARARIVADNLGARDYRIVSIDINTASSQQPPIVLRSHMAMAAMEAESAVAVEGGESEVRVSVNGSVELLLQ